METMKIYTITIYDDFYNQELQGDFAAIDEESAIGEAIIFYQVPLSAVKSIKEIQS